MDIKITDIILKKPAVSIPDDGDSGDLQKIFALFLSKR